MNSISFFDSDPTKQNSIAVLHAPKTQYRKPSTISILTVSEQDFNIKEKKMYSFMTLIYYSISYQLSDIKLNRTYVGKRFSKVKLTWCHINKDVMSKTLCWGCYSNILVRLLLNGHYSAWWWLCVCSNYEAYFHQAYN